MTLLFLFIDMANLVSYIKKMMIGFDFDFDSISRFVRT